MVREIKFRAWDETSDMPMLYEDNYDCLRFIDDSNVGFLNETDNKIRWYSLILMQYTGFKDINDKEIYEGDIMKIKHSCWTEHIQVKFIMGSFVCEQLEKHPKNSGKITPSFRDINRVGWKLEVIGNIYEDKELLE